MKPAGTATLKATIKHGADTFRVVSVGKFSRGFDDKLVLQRQTAGLLGEEVWSTEIECRDEDDGPGMLMLKLLAEGTITR